MNLYLLRHGPARDKADWAPRPDRERPLTKDGARRTKKVAKAMRHMDLSIDTIVTSPYLRALETAQIAAKVLKMKKKLVTTPLLGADRSPEPFLKHLTSYPKDASLLVVGHEPFLSRAISQLCSGTTSVALTLKKAGLAMLVIEKPSSECATLEWLVPPALLS